MSAASSGPGTYGAEYIAELELGSAFFSGSVSLTDYNIETPSLNLLQKTNTTVKGVDNSAFKRFDYPGKYRQGERRRTPRAPPHGGAGGVERHVAGAAMGGALACGTKVDSRRLLSARREQVVPRDERPTHGEQRKLSAVRRQAPRIQFEQAFEAIPTTVRLPPAARHAEGDRPRRADRGGRRPSRRRDLRRQVRAREGAVLLGSGRQEGREELVLDSRLEHVGRKAVGLHPNSAHRTGSDRRLPRGRSGSSDHRRPRVQRASRCRRTSCRPT